MHKSRLAGFIIDCEDGSLERAAEFWSKALGFPVVSSSDPEDENYIRLAAGDELHVELQRVDHPSRVHLDIEADDIEAEVRRLEALGAKRVGQVKTWWVMEAPSGHRFCVVRPQSKDFERRAVQWS